MTPKVTIVIPAYNLEMYIGECLESVLCQKTKFPFKVVVSDDASTDRTPQILQEYQKKYPDVLKVILKEKNSGSYLNAIQLLDRIDSEYISYLDGDDFWIGENRLQHQVDFLDANPQYVLCSGQTCFFVDGKQGNAIVPKGLMGKSYTFSDAFKTPILFHTSGLLLRNVIYRYGMPYYYYSAAYTFEACVMNGEDVRRIIHLEKGPLFVLPEMVSGYRLHDKGEWTGMREAQKALEGAISAHWYKKFYLNKYPNLRVELEQYERDLYMKMWATLVNKKHVYPNYDLNEHETMLLTEFLRELQRENRVMECG